MRKHPDEMSGIQEDVRRGWQRPGRVLAAGAVLVGAALYADGIWGRKKWPSNPHTIQGITADAEHLALTCGGLGATEIHLQAEAARQFLQGEPAHVTYSNDGISIDGLAALFRNTARATRVVHLNGHSMGGPLGLELHRVAAIPNLTLGTVVLNCSPFDATDARLHKQAKALTWLGGLPVGPGHKYLFSLARGVMEGKPFGETLAKARQDATSGGSPRLWIDMLGALLRLNLAGYREGYRPLVGPETSVFYCRPEDPALDTVVYTEQSRDKYAAFFDGLGVPFKDVPIPDVGHAHVEETFAHLSTLARSG